MLEGDLNPISELIIMKEFVVFYAWQSDKLQRLNRHLIRFALNLAAKNISNDPEVGVRVRIDADTEGVLGHVPVTATILKKIDACDAFVPDLTFVATTKAGKLVPNPNVMLEYGYALRAKSHVCPVPTAARERHRRRVHRFLKLVDGPGASRIRSRHQSEPTDRIRG